MAADRVGAGTTHILPLRVYYEDTDSGGVVYYANYLRYAERARTELLRAIGIDHNELRDQDGLQFAVRRCDADYRLPARLDDALEVHTTIEAIKGASVDMRQTVMRDAQVLVVMDVKIACLTVEGRAARLTTSTVERFKQLIEPNE